LFASTVPALLNRRGVQLAVAGGEAETAVIPNSLVIPEPSGDQRVPSHFATALAGTSPAL
jgi:hypothetical protein